MPESEGDFSASVDMGSDGNTTTPSKEETDTAAAPEKPEEGQNKETVVSDDNKTPAPDPALKYKNEAHLAALDTIEVVLSKYSADEQKEFFLSKPELAKIANKSKRFKDDYRKLMESSQEEKPSEEEEKPSKEEEKPSKKEEKPSTEVDMDKLKLELKSEIQEDNLKSSRRKAAYEAAVEQGLNEEQYAEMYKRAEALHGVGTDYKAALDSALVSLGFQASTGVLNLPNSAVPTRPVVDDEAEIKRIQNTTLCSRETAEKIHNSNKIRAKDIDLSEGFVSAPLDY